MLKETQIGRYLQWDKKKVNVEKKGKEKVNEKEKKKSE